jgi:hypothetical protein
MQDTLLLRGCQAGLLVGGMLLILIGIGVSTALIRPLALLAVSGAIAGLIHEARMRSRGQGDSIVAVLLPIAGALSGTFILLN